MRDSLDLRALKLCYVESVHQQRALYCVQLSPKRQNGEIVFRSTVHHLF